MDQNEVMQWAIRSLGRSLSRREKQAMERLAEGDQDLWEVFAGMFHTCALNASAETQQPQFRQNESFDTNLVLDKTPHGVMITDKDRIICWVNVSFTKTTGYRQQEVIGRTPSILQSGKHNKSFYRKMWDAIEQTGCWEGEVWNRRKNGEVFPEWLSISEIRNDRGELTHYVGIFSDITARKLAEEALANARDQALEASRLKSEFLANMSHEIRTPMNGIIGMSDLLIGTPLNDDQREYAGIIRDSAYSLLTIINDILDFSKIEAGKMELEVIDFTLSSIVEGTAELLADKAREKKIPLMTYIDPALPPQLRGDPGRLRQILLNLSDNAIKFTKKGEVVIRAELVRKDLTHVTLRFSVTDTGIGLSETAKKRLFQPFVQADGSTTRKYGGTGLGLSICKRLVEMMGGEIGVDSKLGSGSTFWLTVPLGRSTMSVEPFFEKIDLQGTRVLVMDPSSGGEIVHNYIVAWGMRNGCVHHPDEALAVLRREAQKGDPYDVAIVNLSTQGMDGFSLLRTMQSDPVLAQTKLILLTSFDERGLGEQALKAGFSAYLTKPIRQSQLFDCIANVMNKASQEKACQTVPEAYGANGVLMAPQALEKDRLILLAEDNPVNQRVALLQLRQLGYTAHAVANGKEALEALSRTRYALVLMDCQMPEMDGFATTRAIRKMEATSGRHVPIIAMTANAMQGDRENCIVAGMDDFLSKPVSTDRLQEILLRWMPPAKTEDGAYKDESPKAKNGTGKDSASAQLRKVRLPVGGHPEEMQELLQLFVSSSQPLIAQLQQALLTRDQKTAKDIAHGLKGSSAVMGAEEMLNQSKLMEKFIRELSWDEALEAHRNLQRAWQEIKDFII